VLGSVAQKSVTQMVCQPNAWRPIGLCRTVCQSYTPLSRIGCKTETWLLRMPTTNRKCNISRLCVTPLSIILTGLQAHFSCCKTFKHNILNGCYVTIFSRFIQLREYELQVDNIKQIKRRLVECEPPAKQ